MIVKIQRPLRTNMPTQLALIYSRGHIFETTVPLSLVEEIFQPDQYKLYARISVELEPNNSSITINEILPAQDF